MAESKGGRVAGVILLLAGSAMVVGTFLAWLQLSSKGIAFAEGSVVGQASGIDATYGWAALVAGVITISIALVAVSTGRLGRMAPVVALVAALGAGVAVGYVAATLRERFVDFAVDTASSKEFTPAEIRAEMDELFVQNAVDVGPGVGLIVAGGGAALAAIAAAGSLVAGRRREPSGAGVGEGVLTS